MIDRVAVPTPGELLRAYGRPAKKALGQNFLTHPDILDRIVAAAGVDASSRVLEIGPGPGGLTTRLLATGADVIAVEPDRDAVEHLHAALAPGRSLSVIQGDALRVPVADLLGDPPRVVVANLPYHVATEILFRLIEADPAPQTLALMFQREVAERIVNPGRDRDFSVLSVAVQLRYAARIAMQLPPGAFTPAPKVRSAVVRLDRLATPRGTDAEIAMALQLARAAFGQRRKQVQNTLAGFAGDVPRWLSSCRVPPSARPEELSTADFIVLARALCELSAPPASG